MAKKVKEEQRDSHRKRGALYWGSIIVFAIIVVSFIFVGVPSAGVGSQTKIVYGKYAGMPVEQLPQMPYTYFQREIERLSDQIRQQNVTAEQSQFLTYQILRTAFNNTVFHLAALKLAQDAGLHVSSKALDRAVMREYTEDGEFSEDRYLATPPAERYQIRKFYRETILSQQVVNDLVFGSVVSEAERSFIAGMNYPQRKIRYLVYDFDEYPETEAKAYGEAHPDLFRTMELSRITITSSQIEAEKLYQTLLKEPERFEELARASSRDPNASQGGKMGVVRYADLKDLLSEDDLATIFSMKKGDILGVFTTLSGAWVIVRCDKEAEAPDLTRKDTLDYIKNYLLSYERNIVEEYFSTKASALRVAQSLDEFEAMARDQGKTPGSTGYFAINYGNLEMFPSPVANTDDGNILQAAAYSETFFERVFSTPVGGVTDPVNLQGGLLVAFIEAEKTEPEDDDTFSRDFYSYFAQRFMQGDVVNLLVDKDLLEDRFNEVFVRYFQSQ
ncbi:peptidyl-prolyl cis-trans isomerase [Spirochaeta thermophila]|uniref:PpiC domain-containing protein n=1 Tax=Winmispira thermophila (strain ATCC 49972 / DSM 6192 / RI 19.B1) TaxID=665571 RepID=E0RSV6_WINT6|nr:peptidyl-prolyl cis-trans isomerase [Spirochaeta thermophila]ADN02093.1 hypothetical protein STHERM_c11500 [Spirochaeta thermophila DSM 6192]